VKPEDRKDVAAIMLDDTSIRKALRQTWINVLTHHKKLGYPVISWSNGKIVEIPPDEIVIPNSDPEPNVV
jgi:hypothetical protein